jgi:hypothetical protein
MKWKKLGKIFDLENNNAPDWMNSHASVPFVGDVVDGLVKVYFSSRDKNNCSNIGSFQLDMQDGYNISDISQERLLPLGELGCFDDSGIMGTCLLNDGAEQKLYYIGWNLGVTVPFRNAIGLAESDDTVNFKKLFQGAIIDRTKTEPHFCASCCVLKEGGIYKIWYLSCVKWTEEQGSIKHHYNIKYAESDNGIDWERNGVVAIDFESEYEYAISVPRVLKIDGKYHMWFSSRATDDAPTYRIRYAYSDDGITWSRSKDYVMDISNSGWDSEMVCYPCVFEYENDLYMLYNGNGYGLSGIGLAKLGKSELL